jgi:hypothetical protein
MSSSSSSAFSGSAATFRGRSGVARSLFVGLGPWGTRVLGGVRRQLAGSYGLPEALPILGWLSLDFAESGALAGWRESEHCEFSWDEAAIKNGEWWREGAPKDSRIARALSDPRTSGSFRAQARSAFWRSWPQTGAAVRAALQRVLLAESGQQSALKLGSVDQSLLNIYVVAHLGESAAGGAFDLAYALRDLTRGSLSGETQTARLIGVLGLPESAAAPPELARAFAGLRELNHWSDAHTRFWAQGPNGVRLEAGESETPFDFPTLWAPRNASGYALAGDDLVRAVTQWLALDLQPDVAASRNDDRARLLELTRAQDDWEQPSRFFAAGVASLQFPREQLSQAVAARLASEAWESSLSSPVGFDPARVHEEASAWMRDNEFDARRLLDELDERPEPGRARRLGDLQTTIEDQWSGNTANLAACSSEHAQQVADQLNSQLTQSVLPRGAGAARSLSSPLSASEGDLAAQVRLRFADLETGWRPRAGEFVALHAGDSKWRATGTEALLKAIGARLNESRREVEDACKSCDDDLRAAWAAFETTFALLRAEELSKHGGFLGRGLRKRQAAIVGQFTELGAQVGALLLRQGALSLLRAAFDKSEEAWARPRADLKRFADAVQEEARQLRGRGQAWESAPPVIGQLVLHRQNPDSLRAAATLYARELSESIEPRAPLDGKTASALWREARGPGGNGAFGALMKGEGAKLGEALFEAALVRSREFFRKTAALDLFAGLYPDENAAGARVQELFRAADAYFPLSRGTVVPGWNEGQLRGLRRAGFHNATVELRRSDSEIHFHEVTRSLGFSENDSAPDKIAALLDESRALFWSEVGGFPLRCGGGFLRDLENAYRAHERDPLCLPLHARADVGFWLPIEAPSPDTQKKVWRDFLVALATGAIVFRAGATSNRGQFAWSGAQEIVLASGPDLAREDADSLLPWREVVFRGAESEERARFAALQQKLLAASPRRLVEQIAALLGRINSPRLRRHVSEVLGEWKELLLGPQQLKLESQLQRVRSVLDNPAQLHLHSNARLREQQIEDELQFLRGQKTPALALDPAQELERLLSA